MSSNVLSLILIPHKTTHKQCKAIDEILHDLGVLLPSEPCVEWTWTWNFTEDITWAQNNKFVFVLWMSWFCINSALPDPEHTPNAILHLCCICPHLRCGASFQMRKTHQVHQLMYQYDWCIQVLLHANSHIKTHPMGLLHDASSATRHVCFHCETAGLSSCILQGWW